MRSHQLPPHPRPVACPTRQTLRLGAGRWAWTACSHMCRKQPKNSVQGSRRRMHSGACRRGLWSSGSCRGTSSHSCRRHALQLCAQVRRSDHVLQRPVKAALAAPQLHGHQAAKPAERVGGLCAPRRPRFADGCRPGFVQALAAKLLCQLLHQAGNFGGARRVRGPARPPGILLQSCGLLPCCGHSKLWSVHDCPGAVLACRWGCSWGVGGREGDGWRDRGVCEACSEETGLGPPSSVAGWARRQGSAVAVHGQGPRTHQSSGLLWWRGCCWGSGERSRWRPRPGTWPGPARGNPLPLPGQSAPAGSRTPAYGKAVQGKDWGLKRCACSQTLGPGQGSEPGCTPT